MTSFLPAIPAILHIGFWYLESIAFPRSTKVQKIFLAKNAQNPTAVEVGATMLFNQGFYNLFLAISTLYGLYTENRGLVQSTLLIYIGAALILIVSTKKMIGAAAQGIPALLALLLY